jgi:hypothetical protein
MYSLPFLNFPFEAALEQRISYGFACGPSSAPNASVAQTVKRNTVLRSPPLRFLMLGTEIGGTLAVKELQNRCVFSDLRRAWKHSFDIKKFQSTHQMSRVT